ncbi:hydroxymethylglutaryl-CoA lyase [Alteromonas sediminis]|uniref:Hydroxymethylglutaryl-CoA lyase n=1 Tax=Alteromonas sediminis TaxID=2259342 RepID=A0A3N5XXX5_9ALTE|nr:hydroxymethylglutaryl-CoA lyase [Alteromonas sediminis]RPJ65390.1 hydroxymethylglutaryl-CoA lyase [Alteromonas sediminis]
MTSPQHIVINDVGPRDGLQNQPKVLSIEERSSLINALIDAQLPAIEVGAIVSPKAVPAMAGSTELLSTLPANASHYSMLIPNQKGYELGRDAGAPVMSLVIATSNTMNEKNIRRTTDDIMQQSMNILAQAKAENQCVQAYLATAWACPFEGQMSLDSLLSLGAQLLEAGANKLIIADTIGAASPDQVAVFMNKLVTEWGSEKLACHFHDTRAMGLANVYAAIEQGVREFDASIAGLGGCPFAPGASGNVATEDVTLLVEQMGFRTGIDLEKLISAADLAITLTGTAQGGRSKRWLEKNLASVATN